MAFVLWLPKVLQWPFAPGVFIGILGFLAATMTFWEKPPKVVRAGCVAIFFALMCGEISMISKDREAHDAEQKEARQLAVEQVARMNLLTLQSVDAHGQLTDIKKQIETAKGNPKLVHALEAQAKATRNRIDDISTQLASLSSPQGTTTPPLTPPLPNSPYAGLRNDELAALAKKTANEIQEQMDFWKAREHDIYASSQNQLEILEEKGKAGGEERQKLEDSRVQALKDNNDRCAPNKGLFLRANDIDRLLIARLQQRGIQIQADKSVDDSFAVLTARGADGNHDQRVNEVCSHLLNLTALLR